MVTLIDINKDNWEICAELSVSDVQAQFIASNLYSIAEVQFLSSFKLKGISYNNELAGMVMYGIDPDDGNYWIYRFMIDAFFQGKGIGKQAMALLIDDIKANNHQHIPLLIVGYHQDNKLAHYFYQRSGFNFQRVADWGENIAQLQLV